MIHRPTPRMHYLPIRPVLILPMNNMTTVTCSCDPFHRAGASGAPTVDDCDLGWVEVAIALKSSAMDVRNVPTQTMRIDGSVMAVYAKK